MVKEVGGGVFFPNTSGFSYHSSFTPSSNSLCSCSELDVTLPYVFLWFHIQT